MIVALRRMLGVTHECFASPLNRYFANYCSAFPDTDRFFGSHGPFQQFWPNEGSFEANPPFDQASVAACFDHIGALMRAASGPLSFVVVIPDMDMSGKLRSHYSNVRPYQRHTVVAKVGEHKYLYGLQHRRTGEHYSSGYWEPEKASRIYFFQNDEGAQRWQATEKVAEYLLKVFDVESWEGEDFELEFE